MAKTKAQREAEERLRKNNERIYKQTGYDPDGWRERVAEIARTERNFAQPSRPKKQKDFTYLKNAARNAQDRVAGIDPYAWQNRDYGTKKATETGWRWDFQKPNDAEAVKSEAKQAIAEDKDLIVTKGQQAAAALTSGQDTPEIRAAIKAYEDLQEAARTGKAPEKDLGYTGTKAYVDNAKKGMSAEEVSRTIERGRTAGDFTPYLTAEGEEKNVVSVDGVRSEDVNDIYFLRGLGEDSKAENALYSYGNIKRAEDRNAAAKDAQARGYISSGELLSYSGYKPEKSADELRADRDAAREAMQKAEQRIGEVYHAGGTQAEITAARAAYAQAQKAYQQANYAYNAAYNLNEFTQNETAKAEYDKVRGNADFQKIVEAEKAKGNALPVSTSGIASMPFYSGYYAEEKLAAADPEVIDTAYYIRATQGEEAAKNYLELYDSELEQALADKWLNELYGMGEGLQQGAYKRGYDLSAGVNRFLTGFENLGAWGSEDIPLAERNAIERAQGTLAEGYTGGEKLASDVLYNFGNIAPSAALSFLPGGGQAAALAAMGASTLGGTYADTRRAGYGHEEARLYAAANAGAETMMQYALGGIAKLGAGSGLASKLSSAAQRVAANPAAAKGLAVLGNMGSEAAEEYLQANLDPVLRNAILNEENELDPISEDKWYAALLGAVSAAGMNAASDAAGISQTTNMGKAYNSPDVMQALVQQGLASGADTAANRQAQRLAGKLDAGKAVSNFEAGALAQEIAKAGGALSDPVAEQEVRIPTRREAGALDVTDAGNRIRYEQEIDGVFNGELPTHEEIIMGRTPELLTLYGAPDLPLHMTQATARKIAYPEGYQGGRHNLGIQALKELPEQLSDPVAILESKTQPDSHVVLTEWNDTNGDRVIVPIHFNKNGALKINTNEIVSAYGKGNISALMGKNNENVIYTRNNENIADLLAHGLQLPEPQVSSDFSTYNIPRSGNGVNRQYSAKMNADEMLDRIGTQRAYNPSETVKLANGTEAVVVARDGNSYVVQEPGKQGYSRVSADSITGKVQSASPQADRSIAPEARAALNEKYDHRHVEKLADQAFLDKLEQGRGIKAVIEDMQPGAEAFYDRSTNTIHFAPDSTRADVIGGVAAHELSHAAEASEHYKAYSDYAVQRLFGNDAEALRQAIEAKQEQYVRHGIYLSDADAMAEIVADYTRNLYKSPADIDALVTGNRGMAQSIYDAIRTAIQKIRAFFKGDEAALRNIREYQDLRRAQKLFERALSTIPEVQAEAAPAYSVNKSFAQQVDEVLSNPDGRNFETSHLMMGDTPQKLVDLGMKQLPMLVTSRHIWTIANEAGSDSNVNYHGLGADMVKQLPQAIDDPAIIMVSKTRPNDSVVLLTELIDRQGRPVLAAIRFNGHGNYNNVEIDANVMTSAYGRTGVNNFVKEALEENRILDVNKEKSQFLEKTPGVQFPDNLYKASFEDNIARFRRLVNGETRQYSAGKMQKNTKFPLGAQRPGRTKSAENSVFTDIIPQTDGDVNRQYSLTGTDSEGRTLTAEQAEFFRDSKVRDAEGRLIPVYHGTADDFTVFDAKELRDREGSFFFAQNQEDAAAYAPPGGRIIEAYVNLTNPIDYDNMPAEIYRLPTKREQVEALKKLGYDGWIEGLDEGWGEVSAFYPEQIKLTKNLNPTQNPDIRYSLGEDGAPGDADVPPAQMEYIPKPMDADTPPARREYIPKPMDDAAPPERSAGSTGREQSYFNRTVNRAADEIARLMGVMPGQKRAARNAVRELATRYYRTGAVEAEEMARVFQDLWRSGRDIDSTMREAYADLKQELRSTQIDVSAARKAVPEFEDWRRRANGKLRFSGKDGVPVDVFYEEVAGRYPGLLDAEITSPAQQADALLELYDSIADRQMTLDESRGEAGMLAAAKEFKRIWNEAEQGIERVRENETERQNVRKTGTVTQQAAREAYERIAQLRRRRDRIDRDNLLTRHEKAIAEEIADGKITADELKIPPSQVVRDYAEILRGIRQDERTTAEYKKQARTGRYDRMEELTQNSGLWKDKKRGLWYARETQERNIEDIAKKDPEGARAIKETVFEPIHRNEANGIRMMEDYRTRIRNLELTSAESILVQAYGEGKVTDAELSHYAENAPRKRITITDENGDIVYDADLKGKKARVDADKVKRGVQEFREIYKELLEKANDALVRNGYPPIAERADYFPHFSTQKGMAATVQEMFGFDPNNPDAIPEDIAGLTHIFRPGKKWFSHAQQRNTDATDFDALTGFDRYLNGIKDVIWHTDDIQNVRALESVLRGKHTDEKMRERIREIYATAESDAQAQAAVDALANEPRLPNYVSSLRSYGDMLAGKKSFADRSMEQQLGRNAYMVMRALEGRVASNMIGYNVGSWLTNFIPLVQSAGQVKTANLLRGMKETIKSGFRNDGFAKTSDFLVNRRGTENLVRGGLQKFSAAGVKPMEWIDNFVTESIVRGKYAEEIKAGASPEEAMQRANRTAANIVADRSYGALPTIFHAKNPLSKLLTTFQVEVNNQYSNLLKDIPREARGNVVLHTALALLKYAVGAWLYNELYEKLVGRRPAFDPIGLVQSAAKDYAAGDAAKATTNLVSDVAEQIPFIGGLVGGGRVPVSSAIPFAGSLTDIAENIGNVASGSDSAKDKLWKELLKPAWYIAPPGGGGAVKKAVEGAQAIARGGEYGVDKDGNRKLKFATDGEAGDILRALLFGRYATDGGKEYIENGFKGLSVPQTEAHTHLVENGVKPERAQDIITEIAGITGDKDENGETVTGSEARKKMEAIDKMTDLTADQKYSLYYDMLWGDSLKEDMDVAVSDYGIGKATLISAYKKTYGIKGDVDGNGETISGTKGKKIRSAIDSIPMSGTEEQKTKKREFLYEMFEAGTNGSASGAGVENTSATTIPEAAGYDIPNYKGDTLTKISSIGVSPEDYAYIDDRIGAHEDKVAYLQELGFTGKQLSGLVETFVMGDTAKSKMLTAEEEMNIDNGTYIDAYIYGYSTVGSKSERNAQIRDYVNGLPLSDEQKSALYEWVKVYKGKNADGTQTGGSSGGSSGGRRRSSGGGSKAKQSVPDFSPMAAVIESRPKEVTYSGESLDDVDPDAIWQAMFEAQRGGKTGNRFNFVEDFLSRTS